MTVERFAALAPEAMTAEQRRVAEAIASGPRGSIRGPFKALLRSPELADRVQKLGEYIRFQSALPRKLNELAILVTARKWTAQFEWYAHHRLAMEAGLDPAIAAAIRQGERPEDMSGDEAAVHDFAHQLVHTGEVDDARFDAVIARFGEQGAVDLIAACGYYSLVSFVLNVDRVQLPDGEELPLSLAVGDQGSGMRGD
jgi:4-carboxymuconolactone decarboxylase